MKKYLLRCVASFSLLLTLVGCASHGGPMMESAAAPQVGNGSPVQGQASGRLLIWTARFDLLVDDVDKAQRQLSERMLALGGYVEEKTDYGDRSRHFVFRVPKDAFGQALSSVEQTGSVTARQVKGEDVTERYVDLDTRLKNNIALRDRFKALLGQARDVKDIIQIETELNRIQTEIDAMEARMRVLKDQIQMSTLTVDLRQKAAEKPATIYGPLGYLYKGTEWFVTKLFIIRE